METTPVPYSCFIGVWGMPRRFPRGLCFFVRLLQREINCHQHGEDAEDDRRLASRDARAEDEEEGGKGAKGAAGGRGPRALRLRAGPPQPQVPGDGAGDREGGEEKEKAAEKPNETG